MTLEPCPTCERHVRGETCPFCGAAMARSFAPPRAMPLATRAAFLVGTVALAAGCNTPAAPAYGGPPPNYDPTAWVPPSVTAPASSSAPAGPPSAEAKAPDAEAKGPQDAGKPTVKPAPVQTMGPAPAYGMPPSTKP
jgi:hypothetical protein